jgi:MYXO-CTERM domain-containing protein
VEYVFSPDWLHSFTMCTSDPAIDEAYEGPDAVVAYLDNGGEPENPETPEPEIPGPTGGIEDPVERGGCACDLPGDGNQDGQPLGGLALAALGLAVAMRRRRS